MYIYTFDQLCSSIPKTKSNKLGQSSLTMKVKGDTCKITSDQAKLLPQL